MFKRKIELIVVLLVAISALLAYLFLDGVTTTKTTFEGIYNYNGLSYDITKDMELSMNDNNVLCLKNGMELLETPVYSKDDRKIMLTTKMALYKIDTFDSFKKYGLSPMIEIEYNSEEKNVYINKNTKTKQLNNCFLYDGHNTYVVLEDVYLSYNEEKVFLPALSYVTIETDNWIGFFNSESLEYYEDLLYGSVTLEDIDGDYLINANSDVLICGSHEYLMPSNLEILKDYFEAK